MPGHPLIHDRLRHIFAPIVYTAQCELQGAWLTDDGGSGSVRVSEFANAIGDGWEHEE